MSLARTLLLAAGLGLASLVAAPATAMAQSPTPPRLQSLRGLSDGELVDIYLHRPWLLPNDLSEADWARIRAIVEQHEAAAVPSPPAVPGQ